MLNADIGMYVDLASYLCNPTEISDGDCLLGEVSPNRLPFDCSNHGRVLATCFTPILVEPDSGTAAVAEFSDDYEAWMLEFERVYDLMLQHRTPVQSLLEPTSAPTPVPTVAPTPAPTSPPTVTQTPRGAPCPEECYNEDTAWAEGVVCPRCQNDYCTLSGRRQGSIPVCRNL